MSIFQHQPFEFLPASSEMGIQLREMTALIAADPQATEFLQNVTVAQVQVLADVTVCPKRSGNFRLRRFYWSVQRWHTEEAKPFQARTLEFYAKTRAPGWYDFPYDPDLDRLPGYLAGNSELAVLRYVPLRRLTFFTKTASGEPVIAKVKRQTRFREAAERLATVAALCKRKGTSFAVAAPRGVIPKQHLFLQQALKGEDLARLVTTGNALNLLPRVGALHAELHGLPATNLPLGDLESHWRMVETEIAWLQFGFPVFRDLLTRCQTVLTHHRPMAGNEVFCHGDFVCSQLLVADRKWGVVDFDRCHVGDRYRDMAVFLASLCYDVPAFERRFASGDLDSEGLRSYEDAYLQGYLERSNIRLDRSRLLWHFVCAQIHYLALMLKKDRFSPRGFEGAMQRLNTTCEVLAS